MKLRGTQRAWDGGRPGRPRDGSWAAGRSTALRVSAVCAAGLLALGSVRAAVPPAGRPDPKAVDILERAEAVRNPALDYAIDFSIAMLAKAATAAEWKATYTLVAHGKDRSFILMRTPTAYYGGAMLIDAGRLWLVLPKAEKPIELMEPQILRGDVANGDLTRANLLASHQPRLDGEEIVDGEPCWRLELTRSIDRTRYPRIRYWVAKRGYLPLLLEYYGSTGTLAKIARLGDYRDGPLGRRAMRIEIEDATLAGRKSVMEFTRPRPMDSSAIRFTPEGLMEFRDAALSGRTDGRPDPRPEEFLRRPDARRSSTQP